MAFGSSTTVARLQAVLDADTRGFDSKMRTSQTKTEKFGHIAKAALVGGVAAGFYAVGKAAMIGWEEFNSGQKEAAQTMAVIKSTGGAANVTAEHVQSLGTSLMKLSGIDDELIVNGENLLLTFRGIHNEVGKGNDIFDQATKLTLDLATAMGTDMHSAAIQVGKALNDPIRGYSRLQRIGVDFSDSQIKAIETMDAAGNKMGAQKVILHELALEFGGSAKAAGETFAGQLAIAQERFRNFMGVVVQQGIPYMQRLIKWIGPYAHDALVTTTKVLNTLRDDWRKFNQILDRHQSTVDKVVTVLGFLAGVLKIVARWNIFLYGTLIKVELKVLDVALAVGDKLVGAFRSAAGVAKSVWNWLSRVAGVLKGPFTTALGIALGPILTLVGWLQTLYDIATKVAGALSAVQGSRGTGAPTGRGGSGAGRVNPNRATGGPVFAGRSYTVGERGPETLVMGNASGRIVPNAGATMVYNFNGPVLNGDALLRYIREQDDGFQRRNGRSAF